MDEAQKAFKVYQEFKRLDETSKQFFKIFAHESENCNLSNDDVYREKITQLSYEIYGWHRKAIQDNPYLNFINDLVQNLKFINNLPIREY